mmetsp:Transcript_14571/g.24179  ORF Transcript_14571/g.24179 Transcript_14571/m.24179 type:complete len:308 (-) Transcript_14571:41-964(-)|eukprot:CAMPEP_0119007570 /NCGR_PEP_ID=MMETSP1176-20130426/3100_1 /TAXON_ID=265551 /ORGANISM="Synedropsis recta cf, Strain CCMP1620" /LENGTH=307 /DNA_ID=CAMNT_0006959749 /DNA_START=76 /DNA_END=999 /DNA_ORIENTATION=-
MVMECELPDACGNDTREESLIAAQQKDDGRSRTERILQRDKVLLGACVLMLILMNFQTGRYVLYPFSLFATWVHEMSHGTAAILVGGRIGYLQIFQDGSGLCYYYVADVAWRKAVVASAGYCGTAFWGCILLLFRRTTLGPTIGTIGFGVAMLLSCALYVRNTFGLVVLCIEGLFLLSCGWFLPAVWLDNLYAFLAATSSMNALMDIKNLFGSGQGYVNGEVHNTDAHQVSEYWGNDYRFWATSWFVFAIVMTLVGLFFSRDARELKRNKTDSDPYQTTQTTTVSTIAVPQVGREQRAPPQYWANVV